MQLSLLSKLPHPVESTKPVSQWSISQVKQWQSYFLSIQSHWIRNHWHSSISHSNWCMSSFDQVTHILNCSKVNKSYMSSCHQPTSEYNPHQASSLPWQHTTGKKRNLVLSPIELWQKLQMINIKGMHPRPRHFPALIPFAIFTQRKTTSLQI